MTEGIFRMSKLAEPGSIPLRVLCDLLCYSGIDKEFEFALAVPVSATVSLICRYSRFMKTVAEVRAVARA
jgi:hypothetical protein